MKFDFSLFYPKSKKTGLPPGTMVYTGDQPPRPVTMNVIDYDEQNLTEKTDESVESCFAFKETSTRTWINVDGVNDISIVEKIGQHFELHPLALEDIVHIGQRPKMEEYDSYIYVVLKMLRLDAANGAVDVEQLSMVLMSRCIITFQEKEGDVFDQVRQRIRSGKGRIRKMGCDYLAYALIDAIVDHYFVILEALGEKIEQLEEKILYAADKQTLPNLHHTRHQLSLLRKSVWPLREMVGVLERSESPLFKKATRPFLRDLYDHTIQIVDTIESFREVVSGMLDLNLSMVSTRMNEVMKVLTVIATIFIPLGFVAGVFGMNFDNMPELAWPWAYPIGFWAVIVSMVVAMTLYFKLKKWL
jgi:magnesium transporter